MISHFQIDSLTGLGVVKVECGSQFSVALTKSGAVYTWYVWCSALPKIRHGLTVVTEEMAQLRIRVMSSPGGKGTITGWATGLTTTFDDRDKFRGCKGRRSSPSPLGHCTVCAAQRMVGFTIYT